SDLGWAAMTAARPFFYVRNARRKMTRLSAADELTTPIIFEPGRAELSEYKKANHQANIVRLGEPRVHTNADSLELFDIGGYQVVVKKGQFASGDLAVYIQPDSVVPQTEPFK